jgi:hypothetical protein
MAKDTFWKMTRAKTIAKLALLDIEGMPRDNICAVLFNIMADGTITEDPKKLTRARGMLTALRKDPTYKDIHRSTLLDMAAPAFDEALSEKQKLMRESNNEWLRSNVASDIIALYKPYVLGDEEKALTIKFEGMPEIGTPDGDD